MKPENVLILRLVKIRKVVLLNWINFECETWAICKCVYMKYIISKIIFKVFLPLISRNLCLINRSKFLLVFLQHLKVRKRKQSKLIESDRRRNQPFLKHQGIYPWLWCTFDKSFINFIKNLFIKSNASIYFMQTVATERTVNVIAIMLFLGIGIK